MKEILVFTQCHSITVNMAKMITLVMYDVMFNEYEALLP